MDMDTKADIQSLQNLMKALMEQLGNSELMDNIPVGGAVEEPMLEEEFTDEEPVDAEVVEESLLEDDMMEEAPSDELEMTDEEKAELSKLVLRK